MHKKIVKNDNARNSTKTLDVCGFIVAFAIASFTAFIETGNVSLSEFLGVRVELGNIILFLSIVTIWHVALVVSGFYDRRYRHDRRVADFLLLVVAVSMATLIVAVAASIFRIEIVSTTFLGVFWIASFVLIAALRQLQHSIQRGAEFRGQTTMNVVIAGTNRRAMAYAEKLVAAAGQGYRLLGFVDCEWRDRPQSLPGTEARGYAMVSDLEHFDRYLHEHVVDEVIICMPVKSLYDESSRITAQCEEQGIRVRYALDLFSSPQRQARVDLFADDYLVTVNSNALAGRRALLKYVLDFVLASVLLLLLAPLLLVIAGLVKRSSPGPILFRQDRLGLNKRRFQVYKFRTMVADAEARMAALEGLNEVAGPVFKIKHDPRVTPIGRLLRRTSLDELPQLLNVIRGEMSLVGPRPLPIRDYEGFSQNWHRRRFSVRPGITCLWQVQGRNAIPFDEWMKLDMRYIDSWSLWLDMKILCKTIPAVLRGSGT